MYKRKILASIGIILMVSILLVATPQKARSARFVLASWSYPDEYGQGVEKVSVEINTTGSWLPAQPDSTKYYYESGVWNWTQGSSIKLTIWTWFNSTLVGLTDWEDGVDYQRHTITVTNDFNEVVFSQENITFDGCFPAIDPPMWYYYYSVIIDILPIGGVTYRPVVSYEIFY